MKTQVKNKTLYTDYNTAVYWCHNQYIMLNNIRDIDPDFEPPYFDCDTEYFQFFISNCSDFDKEYLEKSFDLIFAYSEKLDKWVLCVDHWGTGWDYVLCRVKKWEHSPAEMLKNTGKLKEV